MNTITTHNIVTQLEIAEALGFSTVEQMEDHQVWLDSQAVHRAKVKSLVENSKESNIIDLRTL